MNGAPLQRAAAAQAPVPVAFVSSHSGLGGSERYLVFLLAELDRAWVRTVVCLQNGPLVADLKEAGHPTAVIDTGASLSAILASAIRLRRVLRGSGAAVVHANGIKAAIVSVLATVGARIPVVWFKHDVRWDGWRARAIASRCAIVVAPSSVVASTFRGRTRQKVEILPYQMRTPSVSADEARMAVLDALKPDVPDSVVILVGRLDPFKGHRELLAVAGQLVERLPGLRLLFVGGEDPAHADNAAVLRREVSRRGLDQVVRFTGHRQDALALIAGSDVLVIPSVANEQGMGKEAFPYVGLEALALGTPVVAYAHGGVPEQLGECGLLVPPGDRTALGAALLGLIEDRGERERLANCGRERFATRFALRTLPDDAGRLYRRAVGEGRPA